MNLNKKVANLSNDFGLALIALICIAILMIVNGQIASPF
jgi:hypothetical protein